MLILESKVQKAQNKQKHHFDIETHIDESSVQFKFVSYELVPGLHLNIQGTSSKVGQSPKTSPFETDLSS